VLTVADFRRIALKLQGATEGSHMGHPDFRANGRIFASIYPDNRRAMVRLTPDLQQQYVDAHPGIFEPATGAWGRQGSTTVHLALAQAEIVTAAIGHAWRATARRSRRR
jgi:hypothetical protein